MKDTVDSKSARFSRRQVLAGSTAALGGLVAAGAFPGMAAASSQIGFQKVPSRGKPRTLVWALAAIGAWNLSYDVGFYDACNFLGWKYKKVGMPLADYSASTVVQVISQAIQLKPDVLVTPLWVEGEGPLLAEAQNKGIYVMCNNANNFPDDLTKLNIPYVGGDFFAMGQKSAAVLLQTLAKLGKKSGVILMANDYPENLNITDRVLGAEAAINQWNKAKGTNFTYVQLNDNSANDQTGAINLWRAKIVQLGKSLVAAFPAAYTSQTAAVTALQGLGYHAGQLPMAAIDITTETLQQLQAGWVECVVDSGYYMSGWLPTMIAWQVLERDFPISGSFDASGAAITRSTVAGAIAANNLQTKLGKSYGVALD
jgi:ABC-type sugar transport system substrate-binding protein